MSLQNLSEDFLYGLLPEGIISLDEQALIQAVVGGYQDRVDDLRAYTGKLELLLTGQGLPESDVSGAPPNAVIAQVQSPKGKVYSRSLEIKDDTPEDATPELLEWVAGQLKLDEEHVLLSAAYGVDSLRLVEANVLPYLAATVGAVLYRSAALDPANADSDARRLLSTWFPRLQFKGTAQSFETLGRLLGYDDVRMTPLWQRLSPRIANDIGDPRNDQDFSEVPDFYPKQVRDNFYDPWNLTDGPYYTWTGTATARNGTNSTEFYTQVVNGFNPFFKVSIIGTAPMDPDPSLSPYILTGGGPETKAYVNPSGTGLRFEAISAGSAFNHTAIQVTELLNGTDNGTHRVLSVTQQLSSIKYRSSYYDLSLTIDFDRAEQLFGVSTVDPNKDLQANGTLANFGSQALSPYRPWMNGSFAQGTIVRDWLTETDPLSSQTAITYRRQADLGDQQLNYTEVTAAGLQVIQAMEEVRPATRRPRNVSTGYLIKDQVGYADYCSFGTVFSATSGQVQYWGTLADYPYPPYEVQFSISNTRAFAFDFTAIVGDIYQVKGTYDFLNWFDVSPPIIADSTLMHWTVLVGTPFAFFNVWKLTGAPVPPVVKNPHFVNVDSMLTHESDPYNSDFLRIGSYDLNLTGTYDYSNSTWFFNFPIGFGLSSAINVYANYAPTSTEVVREQPSIWSDPTYIAVSADGGIYGAPQAAVSNLVRGWNPDAYFYAGDNQYYDGLPGEFYPAQIYVQDFIDAKKYFVCYGNHDYQNPDSPIAEDNIQSGNIKGYDQTYRVYPTSVGPQYVVYNGGTYTYGQIFVGVSGVTDFLAYNGATVRRRAEPDNGWDNSLETNYYDYLPGNGRYYRVRIGHVELFVVADGYNSVEDPGFIDNNRKPAEPDGNWCEAPFSPIGANVKLPYLGNPIQVDANGTYTVKTSDSYGDDGINDAPQFVIYSGGTYYGDQTFKANGTVPFMYVWGEPRIDPATPWVVLRKARRYRVIANPGNNYVDYEGKRYYGGDVIQASFTADKTVAFVTGRVRLDRMNSVQAEQIKDWIRRSQAPWKVVMYHHPNWNSDAWNSGHKYGDYPRTDWPWKEWGVDLTLHGHVHAYARSLNGGITRIIIGFGGQNNQTWNTSGTAHTDPYVQVQYNTSPVYPYDTTHRTDYGAMLMTATPTSLNGMVQTINNVVVDNWTLTKPDCVRAYQERPEDQLDEPMLDLSDEYPWRRDLVNGGELIDRATYNPPTPDVTVTQVGQSIAVFSQTGAQYDVTLNKLGPNPPSFMVNERPLTPYVPGQMAVAYYGTFIPLDHIDPRQRDDLPRRTLSQEATDFYHSANLGVDHSVDDMDWAFEPGWRLYHFGLVQGVLVADPVKFFGRHHRDNLVGWFPFNEHPFDAPPLIDHSVISTDMIPLNATPFGREFDQWRGWHLRVPPGLDFRSDPHSRDLSGPVTVSFWLMVPEGVALPAPYLIQVGSIKITFSNILNVGSVDSDGNTNWVLLSGMASPGWNFFSFTYDGVSAWTCYQATMSTPVAQVDAQTYTDHIWTEDQSVGVVGTTLDYRIHDLRVWNSVKTIEELELVRYHDPNPTACLYRPAYLTCVNDYDRYGVKVLDSGYVMPDLLPSSIETPSEAWVSRYDATGQYQAQSRFKETGIGSGPTLPVRQVLGEQWDTLTAAGTVVVSGWKGQGYGMNDAWMFDNPPPQVMQLLESGSTKYGIIPTWFSTGTTIPWPNAMMATNPCRDRIWVEGDDSYVYEIKVVRSGTQAFGLSAQKLFTQRSDAELMLSGTEGTYAPLLQLVQSAGIGGTHCYGVTSYGTIFPRQLLVVAGTDSTTDNGLWTVLPKGRILGGSVLPSSGTYDIRLASPGVAKVYHPAKLLYSEQPTGGEVVLTDTGYSKQLRVNTSGQVYAAAYAGTVNAPWIFMYGNEEVVTSATQAQAYSNWANPTSFGVSLSLPALNVDGNISFENDETALPGFYRLEIDSGNIGQVDENFDGFKVIITVGDIPFEATLCAGKTGANFQSTDTFDFTLPHVLPGNTLGYSGNSWLLDINWYNALRDERRGTARQLAIYGYRMVRLNTTLYQLKLTATGSSITEVSTTGTDFPATPGGWMAAITSWGTAYSYTHESRIYSSNETFQSRYPMSNVLTATTVERKEDIVMNTPAVISDPPVPTLPVYGPIVIT
jgi:hypothetical protein